LCDFVWFRGSFCPQQEINLATQFDLTLKASHVIAGGNAPGTNPEKNPTLTGSHAMAAGATLSGSELIVDVTGGVAPGYYMSRLRREEGTHQGR
jgi:hypothetical protein